MAEAFKDLKVWKKGIALSIQVYRFTGTFPREELYGLVSQMRRASVSIASNIAEGSARGRRREFRQFVKLAEGSNCELQTQLLRARQLGFGDKGRAEQIEIASNEVGRILTALCKYLSREIAASASSKGFN
ncbi:MAG TPA: four helix bundle protein [Acidobacteriaceae bacterium]|nr:four helix bundle protein [Acidobacteriaceae bacterium]